jgi:hypothetical protein
MINVLAGKKGIGKTKVLIEMANKWSQETRGNIIYIDDDNRHMYDLGASIRLINTSEFEIKNMDAFLGFVCGVIAGNYDIDRIYIDGLLKITPMEDEEMEEFFNGLEFLSKKFRVKFSISINREPEELPEFMKKYIVI